MRRKFKKILTCLIILIIVSSGWIPESAIFPKPAIAEAATSSIQSLDDSEAAPNFTKSDGSHWDTEAAGNLNNSQTTNGNFVGEWARWKFHANDTGRYLIMVSWLASVDRAANAAYSLLDSALTPQSDIAGFDSFIIDQTKNANGNAVGVPTWSDYRLLSFFDLATGDDYYINLSGANANKVNADSIMIVYDGLNPYNPTISINSGAIYTNNRNVNLFLSAEDNLGVELMQVSETDPIPASTTLEEYQAAKNFILSAGDGLKTVYVQYFDIVLNVSAAVSDSIILDTTVPTPTNISASKSGNVITVDWDDVLDNLSGLSGYNIYSSSDGFANKINSSLIPAGTSSFGDTIQTNGSYSYKIEAVDDVGNVSALSSESVPVIIVNNIVPVAPSNVTVWGEGKKLIVSWDAVGGGVAGYIVTINGVSRDVGNVITYSTDLSYGTYTVLVTSYYSADSFGINDPNGLSESKNAAITAGLEKSVTLAPTVKTATVSQVGITPESVVAAETPATVETPAQTDTSDTGLKTEEEGKIKGEEENTEQTEEKINWTPWIILFVLIILAGAATGGYFYWFAGEEEVETKIKVKPEAEKRSTVKTKAKSASSKKPRRW